MFNLCAALLFAGVAHAAPGHSHPRSFNPNMSTTRSGTPSAPTMQTPGHHSPPPAEPTRRVPTSRRHKVLFITDSIGMTADIRHLEEATNTLIYTEKAYGASFKSDSFKPNDNFVSVSNSALSKMNFSYAILQGSATDITNLDTSSNSSSHHELLKQEVFIASQNMISAARNIIVNNPSIKKVLILDRIPRFDPRSTDPAQLKSSLSRFANTIFRKELEKCDVRDRISIGAHSLPEKWQQNLYGHPHRFGYDGIELRGPDGGNYYTRSVCNIIQSLFFSHSRDPHNHVIPSSSSDHQPSSGSLPKATSPTPEMSNPKPTPILSEKATRIHNKPEHVVIDIEPQNLKVGDSLHQYFYSVPTYNPFSPLGN